MLPPFRIRFRLRTILILFAVVSAVLGWHVHRVRQHERLRFAIVEAGGNPLYQWNFVNPPERLVSANNWVDKSVPPGPAWMRKLIGREHFDTIIEGYFGSDYYDKQWNIVDVRDAKIGEFLDRLVSGAVACPAGLVFDNSKVTDETIALVGELKDLRYLYVYCPLVTEKGVIPLRSARSLERLSLYVPITDAAIEALSELGNLRELNLEYTQVTDQSVENLAELSRLTYLKIPSGISADGERKLRELLPNCRIVRR